ncbi:hypothetical protein KPC03_00457 [Klebsiella pneumoniae]|nr:hypothetical protein [Klebsiella pneumoniae]
MDINVFFSILFRVIWLGPDTEISQEVSLYEIVLNFRVAVNKRRSAALGLVLKLPAENLNTGFVLVPDVSMTCFVLINHTVINL